MTGSAPTDPLHFTDADGWRSWLESHHEERPDAWLRIGKRGSTLVAIDITDALDVALCFGWIDGQRRAGDADSYLQRYSRRRPRSPWSRINVDKVDRLNAAGQMHAAGLAEVAAAQADGRWEAAYESQARAEVPPDLAAALAAEPRAQAAFEQLGRSERYAVMLPRLKAFTPATRERAVARAVAGLVARS